MLKTFLGPDKNPPPPSCILNIGSLSRPATLIKRDSNTGVFLRILQNFKDTHVRKHLQTAASELNITEYLSAYLKLDRKFK